MNGWKRWQTWISTWCGFWACRWKMMLGTHSVLPRFRTPLTVTGHRMNYERKLIGNSRLTTSQLSKWSAPMKCPERNLIWHFCLNLVLKGMQCLHGFYFTSGNIILFLFLQRCDLYIIQDVPSLAILASNALRRSLKFVSRWRNQTNVRRIWYKNTLFTQFIAGSMLTMRRIFQ